LGKLAEWLKQLAEVEGTRYMVLARTIQRYIKEADTATLVKEVGQIEELDHLRLLWSLGVPKRIYDAVLRRIAELGGGP